MKKIIYTLLITLLASCNTQKQEPILQFETIRVDTVAKLLPSQSDSLPNFTIHLNWIFPTSFKNERNLKKLQKTFIHYFVGEKYTKSANPQKAVDNYVNDCIQNYLKENTEPYKKRLKQRQELDKEEKIINISFYCNQLQTQNRVVFSNHKIISIANENYFYGGGAHGVYGTYLTTIDLINFKKITFNNLFIPNYENQLGKMIRQKLNEKYSKETFFEFEKIEPTENFYLTDKGVTFIYNIYEIASYADGQFIVDLTYKEIKNLLQSNILEKYELN